MGIDKTSWLVTGGCGFIGTSLIKYLIKENPAIKIRVLDNLSVGTKDDLSCVCSFSEKEKVKSAKNSSLVELIIGDIIDFETCLKCCKGVDVVVHLAANTGVGPSVENPKKDLEANVIGTFNMLEAARANNVKRFIFASSGAPVGEVEPPIHEEMVPHPVSPYGASKLAGEAYCSAYFRSFGLETISLRFGNVYGPGSNHKNSVIAKFIKQAMNGETLEIYGDGKQTRDFIYIEDLVNAIILSQLTDNIGGETFQIATNRETTVGEMTDILVSILKENRVKIRNVTNGDERLGDVKRNYSNTLKAKEILGWECKWLLDNGLKETVEWFLNNDY